MNDTTTTDDNIVLGYRIVEVDEHLWLNGERCGVLVDHFDHQVLVSAHLSRRGIAIRVAQAVAMIADRLDTTIDRIADDLADPDIPLT